MEVTEGGHGSENRDLPQVETDRRERAMKSEGTALTHGSSFAFMMSNQTTFARKMSRTTSRVGTSISGILEKDWEAYRDAGRSRTLAEPDASKPSDIAPIGGIGLLRHRLKKVLVSRFFDMAIGLVIIANSVTIGVELSLELDGKDTSVMALLEDIWLAIYVAELALRVFAMGLSCFHDNWVKFDAVLVFVGVVNSWILAGIVQGDTSDEFGFVMVLRMMRLGRLARTVRLLVKFRALWMLVRGMLSSAGTIFYTFILLSVVLYIFAALGVELITNNKLVGEDAEFGRIVQANFDSLSGIMLTLVQFVCMDSIGAIYRPLIQKDATLLFYFAAVILVVPIVLMNLVTAIVVNTALEQANADKEMHRMYEEQRKVRLVKKLRDMFQRLDEDCSGQVSQDEILNIDDDDARVLQDATGMSEPLAVFNALNIDESDTLSIDDFCNGIWDMATSTASIEVRRMEKQVQIMFKRIKSIEQTQSSTNSRLDLILHQVTGIAQGHIVPPSPQTPPRMVSPVNSGSSSMASLKAALASELGGSMVPIAGVGDPVASAVGGAKPSIYSGGDAFRSEGSMDRLSSGNSSLSQASRIEDLLAVDERRQMIWNGALTCEGGSAVSGGSGILGVGRVLADASVVGVQSAKLPGIDEADAEIDGSSNLSDASGMETGRLSLGRMAFALNPKCELMAMSSSMMNNRHMVVASSLKSIGDSANDFAAGRTDSLGGGSPRTPSFVVDAAEDSGHCGGYRRSADSGDSFAAPVESEGPSCSQGAPPAASRPVLLSRSASV